MPPERMPPWIRDSRPELWTTLPLAAKFYFRKSRKTIREYILTGYLEENGIPSWFDGRRWYVRLPYPLGRTQTLLTEPKSR